MIDPEDVRNQSRPGPHPVSLLLQYMALGSGSMATSISSRLGKGCMIRHWASHSPCAQRQSELRDIGFPDSPVCRHARPGSASYRWHPRRRAPFKTVSFYDVRDALPLQETADILLHLKAAGARNDFHILEVLHEITERLTVLPLFRSRT